MRDHRSSSATRAFVLARRAARLALVFGGGRRNRDAGARGLASGRRALALAGLAAITGALAAGPISCSGEHDDLGLADATSSASGQGASGAEGGAGASSPASSGSGAFGGEGGDGPVGPTRLTLVNGIVNADQVKLCAIGYPGGEGAEAAPWPTEPLAFGAARVIDPIEQLFPADVDVQLHVLSGDLSLAGGASCGDLVGLGAGGAGGGATGGVGGGGGPALRVTALPVLPANVFASGKSVLLVPTGCVAGLESDSAKLACGEDYAADAPTATLAALGIDEHSTFDRVGIQVVHASLAMPMVDVRVKPGNDSNVTQIVAPFLSFGAAGPNPAYGSLDQMAYGTLNEVEFRIHNPGESQQPLDHVSLNDALDLGGLAHEDFDDGKNLVFVAVGAAPGVAGTATVHALTMTAVRATPKTR